MSHITEVKMKIELKNEDLVRETMRSLEKAGYKVLRENNGDYVVDLKSKGVRHLYDKNTPETAKWSQIRLKKTNAGYVPEGDRWSIERVYDQAVADIEQGYTVAAISKFMQKNRYFVKQEKKNENIVKLTAWR